MIVIITILNIIIFVLIIKLSKLKYKRNIQFVSKKSKILNKYITLIFNLFIEIF